MNDLYALNALGGRIMGRDLLYSELVGSDIDPITSVPGVPDEQENARTKNLLTSYRKYERQREECSSECGRRANKAGTEESH